jgi:phospholipase D1/2
MAELSTRSTPTRPTLFEPGRNCWRVERARRASFIVDADAYFKAFVEAARRAERSILIVGWDFHSRTRLLCSHDNDHPDQKDCELELGEFLNELARTHRELQIHILIWDYPMIFGLDREWGPTYGWGWKPHRRIHFRYDNTHPIGGSHHQKVVVIDDAIAFNGGIDLTCRRWDTVDHAPDNQHRTMRGTPYPPFHDLMMVVDGDAALALGNLVRERWHKATHETIQPPRPRRRIFRRSADARSREARWPASIEPTLRDIDVAISRTEPAANGNPGVREVEALYLDIIAAARRCVYIENQYFTADRIGDALAARLAEPDGPEVVIVLRELSHGWLEELTMQTLRTRLIDKLRAADVHGRFRVYYPYIAGLKEGTCIDVHSKFIVIDDELARVGSANLANRSLGLDTECDLTIEARDREDVREVIRNVRACLLAEHLGFALEEVRSAIEAAGNLRDAIDGLHRDDRTLNPLTSTAQVSEAVLTMISVADPEKPVELSDLAKLFTPETEPASAGGVLTAGPGPAWGKLLSGALVLIALTAAWKFTPLATFLDANLITGWARRAGGHWVAPILTILAYTPAALTMFPRPLITLFAVIAFGPLLGFAYAMLGIELSAWVTFVVGQKLSRETVRRVAGEKLDGILKVLRKRGLIAMTALRLVPLAPFAVEGVVAGAVRVKLSDFLIGTAIGILPGTLASTVFGDQLQVWLENPSKINYWLIAVVLALLGGATWYVRRWLIASSGASRSGVKDARAA